MEWKNTWGYTQQDYRSWPSLVQPETQKIKLISNHKSLKMKVGFANRYGIDTLMFASVVVNIYRSNKLIKTAQVLKDGQKMIEIRPNERFLSDVVSLAIDVGDSIEYVTETIKPHYVTSGTVTYCREQLHVENYDSQQQLRLQTATFKMVQENPKMMIAYGISSVQLLLPEETQTLVAFGDSLTQQGFWVDYLKERLLREKKPNVALLNRGIGGNRVLVETDHSEDGYFRHGQAGIKRFEEDVFGSTIPDTVIVFHGINDFIHQQLYQESDYVLPVDVIAGLQTYSKLIRQYGSKGVIGTLTPLKESCFFSKKLEAARIEINQWIRSTPDFDYVLDFDQMVREPNNHSLLHNQYDSGDGLHLSAHGGQAIANQIDLSYLGIN